MLRKPGRLARAASKSRQARITIRGPALWGAAAAAILLLAGASYLAWQANAPGTASTAAPRPTATCAPCNTRS